MKTLTLSGWTQPVDAIARALPGDHASFDYSDYANPEASFAALGSFADAEAVIGWSMGGQVAVRAIAAGVLRPKHLTLIATPYQFVNGAGFEHGMDVTTYRLFRENYATDPARTKMRFHSLLAKGDVEMKRILPLLGHHHDVENTARWLPWFDMLGTYSLAGVDLSHLPPTLLVQGSADAIVPANQAQHLRRSIPEATVSLWEGVAHAPHIRDPQRLHDEILTHRARFE